MRALSLAAELPIAVALALAFIALLVQGSAAGRLAHRALTWGAAAGLLGAALTLALRVDDEWLMGSWRCEPSAQLFKALVLAGALVSVRLSRGGSDWHPERATGPMFRLVCVAGLLAAVSAGDLVVLWLALDIATAGLVFEIATAGRWSTRDKMVRRLVATWLPASLVMLLGIILVGSIGASTRLTMLEGTLPGYRGEPAVIAGLALVGASVLTRTMHLVAVLGAIRRA